MYRNDGSRAIGLSVVPAGLIAGAVQCLLLLSIFLLMKAAPDYGYLMFMGGPFISGFVGSLLLAEEPGARFGNHVLVSLVGCLSGAALSIVFVQEGGCCLLMAAPLTFGISLVGNAVGYALRPRRGPGVMVSFLAMLPLAFLADRVLPGAGDMRSVSSSVIIDAPPEKVWPLLENIGNLPEPDFWLFRMGVATPMGSRMDEKGLGARRWCVLSTGAMPEEILEWEPNRRMGFKMLWTPPAMKEWNPFGDVKAAHLSGYFTCDASRFELIPLPGGKTKLVGTSWYHHRFRPFTYWNLWTDKIVKEVQLRMFKEVSRRAAL